MGANKSLSRQGTRYEAPPSSSRRDTGERTLKGSGNNRMGCLFTFIFGAIWNSVVIGILVSMLSDFDNMEWFALLFLIPFLLVGIGVAIAFIYCLLALFNPRPEITLSTGYLPLGSSAHMDWSFQGNPSRISTLTISICGVEKATYRRGTTTTTDESIFEKQVLVETENPREIMAGRVSFTIPEFTAPSFAASNNKIVWMVRVHGDIKRWPDVNEEFEFDVAPLPPVGETPYQAAEFRSS
jgi:hypothetical protein